MMNKKTRRLSKMPDEVRAEISPWFIEKQAIVEDTLEKIRKLDETANHGTSSLKVLFRSGFSSYGSFQERLIYLDMQPRKFKLILWFFNLQPKRSDLDMNHHVNNVKYVGWMLEV